MSRRCLLAITRQGLTQAVVDAPSGRRYGVVTRDTT